MAYPLIDLHDPAGEVGRLLEAAAKVAEHEARAALVGGLAVICRLATAHRVTLDADSLARTEGLLAILRDRPDASPAPGAVHGVALDGAVVEVIEVQPLTDDQVSDVEDPKDRLFVAGHWWAYDNRRSADAGQVGLGSVGSPAAG